MPQVAYGVRIESDMLIDGLPAPCGDEIATVHVCEDPALSTPAYSSPDAEPDFLGLPLRLSVNGDLEARWGDRAYYRIGVGNAQIRCFYGPAGDPPRMRQWLLHWALPLYVVIGRHLVFLHGGSVRIGDAAIAFLAPSGIGKTTTVEYFVGRGHGFLTEDKLGIVRREGRYWSVPSTPFLFTDEAKTQWRRTPNFERRMSPLSAIYLLTPADPRGAPAIEPIDPARAAFELGRRNEVRLPESIRQRLGLPHPAVGGFPFYCGLAAEVRVNRLHVPRALPRLPEVYDTVMADVESHR